MFNKHNHSDFVADACPPWDLQSGTGGLFPHPPSPTLLQSKVLPFSYSLS